MTRREEQTIEKILELLHEVQEDISNKADYDEFLFSIEIRVLWSTQILEGLLPEESDRPQEKKDAGNAPWKAYI